MIKAYGALSGRSHSINSTYLKFDGVGVSQHPAGRVEVRGLLRKITVNCYQFSQFGTVENQNFEQCFGEVLKDILR